MAAIQSAMGRTEERRRARSRWLQIPSWAFSLALHAALLLTIAVTLHRPTRVGDPSSDNFETGIYFDPNGNGDFDAPGRGGAAAGEKGSGAPGEGGDEPPAEAEGGEASAAARPELKLDDEPPVALALPARTSVGTGGPLTGQTSATTFGDAREMIRSIGTGAGRGGNGGTGVGGRGGGDGRGGGGSGGGGGGGGKFFGHSVEGRKFVYVIDISGSMRDYNAISRAKAELLASLAQLNSEQQFQIIFYNEHCYPMRADNSPMKGADKPQYFFATEANRALASQFIRNTEPDLGTVHLPAIQMALSYNPDVIFFLTDAGEPILYASDLDLIKRRNNGRTQIHTIEFGKGANLPIDNNFLKKLAKENSGGYVYRDVRKFNEE